MPRLTTSRYLECHRFLRYAWANFPVVFAVVSINQQWELHRFFQTQVEAYAAELITGRKCLTAAEPSLPHRAGKVFERVYAAFRVAYEASGGDEIRFRQAIARLAPQPRLLIDSKFSAGSRSVRALAIARREPDAQLLAKALHMQAMHTMS